MNKSTFSVYFHPIKILLVFLIFTEALYFWGPIKYNIRNPLLMAIYFLILNVSLYLGYKYGVKNSRCTSYNVRGNIVKLLLIIGLFLNVEHMRITWATHGMSFSLANLVFALVNPGDAYSAEASMEISANPITGILLSPIRWSVITLGIYYWKRLSRFFRLVVVLAVLFYGFTWLGIGTRKGLLDLIIVSYFSVIAVSYSLHDYSSIRKKLNAIIISTIVIFVIYFIFSNMSRAGLSSLSDFGQVQRLECREFYLNNLSSSVLYPLYEITNYLCQGYNALNISLSELGIIPPTIGGSSMSLWNYLDTFLGFNPMPHTYMYMLEEYYGIDMYINWHSAYLWIANDVTFIFVPLIVFIIGLYFGRVWKDALFGHNPWAYPVLGYMIVEVFYFFANNQVLSFSLESFLGCVLIYEYTRLKIR